jgi:Protein kinase domain
MAQSRHEEIQQRFSELYERATEEEKTLFEEAFWNSFPGSDLKLKLPSLTAQKEQHIVYFNRVEIPEEDDRSSQYLEELKERVSKAQLINSDGLMDEDKLFDLVYQTTNGGCQKFRPRRVAQSTNLIQEDLYHASDCGKMFLHQVVFSPIAELFSCFDLSLYCAKQPISCAHIINSRNVDGRECWNQVGCSPDAAIRLTDEYYLIAMMEVKEESFINANDKYRCKLMTSVSLLALDEYRKNHVERDVFLNNNQNASAPDSPTRKVIYENLAMPYVLCNKNVAHLYVTRLVIADEKVSISVTHVISTPFCSYQYDKDVIENVKEKVEFMAILAILVADIFAIAGTVSSRMGRNWQLKDPPERKRLPNAIEGTTSPRSSRDSCSSEASNQTCSSEASNQTQGSMDNRVQPDARETTARIVASWNGKVQQLKFPWTRVAYYNLDATQQEQWEADMEFYMQNSPFYFRGVYGAVDVFCKVWREGDPKTCRQDIVEEIEFNRLANESGVPSCKIFDELTAMDVNAPSSSDDGGDLTDCKYHVLVSEYHRNYEVAQEDVLEFAISLVGAVLILHNIGVLHCDIKPSNILWDADAKMARLVDFGLAQKEENARSYHATRNYEAPEIKEGIPHSRWSDAFSVGKTIEEIVENADAKEVLHAAKLLQCPSVADRLSLEGAAKMLALLKASSSTAGLKRNHEDMEPDSSTIENKNV